MLAQPRQVHHEGVFVLAVNLLLNALEIVILAALGEFAAQDLFPVRTPFDLLHAFAGDFRARPRGGERLHFRRRFQMVVIKIERFVEIVDLGQIRIGEDIGENPPLAALLGLQFSGFGPGPAAVPAFLVFPVLGIADAGFGLDIVEPGVLDPFAAGPDVLAGHRTGVAADAFVEIEHHADLRADFH
jgi:hypothetical protein